MSQLDLVTNTNIPSPCREISLPTRPGPPVSAFNTEQHAVTGLMCLEDTNGRIFNSLNKFIKE